MDLQLYRVDSQNYLVDFRNIGYYLASENDTKPEVVRPVALGESLDQPLDIGTVDSPSGTTRQSAIRANSNKPDAGIIGGVSGPFHFLEMACQLIAELASG